MAEIKKVKVSELNELKDPRGKGYWIFGYKTEGGKPKSEKVSWDVLTKVIDDAVKTVQLERRMVMAMERTTQKFPVAEEMNIYRIVARNVAKLEIKELRGTNPQWQNVPLDVSGTSTKAINLKGDCDIVVRIEPTVITNVTVEDLATTTIFARAIPK